MTSATTALDLDSLITSGVLRDLRTLTKNWRASDLASVMEPLSAEKEADRFPSAAARTGRKSVLLPATPSGRRTC